MKEITMRRSESERKLGKEKKKERKEKAQSTHFDGNGDLLVFCTLSIMQETLLQGQPSLSQS